MTHPSFIIANWCFLSRLWRWLCQIYMGVVQFLPYITDLQYTTKIRNLTQLVVHCRTVIYGSKWSTLYLFCHKILWWPVCVKIIWQNKCEWLSCFYIQQTYNVQLKLWLYTYTVSKTLRASTTNHHLVIESSSNDRSKVGMTTLIDIT